MDFLQSKKIIWVFAIIAIAAVLVAVIAGMMAKKKVSTSVKSEEVKVNQKEVDQTKLPDKFPSEIPLEQGAKITQNYNATGSDGRFQATRAFVTAKTLDANYKIYTDFFKNNGWQLETGVNQTEVKVINASKDKLHAQVTLNYNVTTQLKTVDITIAIIP